MDIRRYRDRAILALAASIAVHEIVTGVLPGLAKPRDTEHEARTTQLVLETPRPSPTPRPTPKPTPSPTPPPPVTPPPRVTPPPHVTPAPVRQVAGRARGVPTKKHGGGAPHVAHAHATAGRTVSTGGTGAGTGGGHGTAAGAAAGGLNGNGTGDQGTGNGAVNADTPCGFVDFIPTRAPRYSNGTAYEMIKATVTFGDGHIQDARFPYEWVYPNGEQTDPWSDTNLRKSETTVRLQLPPPGSNVASMDPLIQYILKHTGSDGLTDLPECPRRRG